MTDSAQPTQDWSAADSAELYGINAWGAGYYSIADSGDAQVTVNTGEGETTVSLMDIVAGMRARSLEMPAVLRIRNVLDHRIKVLNEAFADAISSGGYNNVYRGVFPIKVNQQCHVIEELGQSGWPLEPG